MVENQAIIIEQLGDDALVELERTAPCGICGQTRGCGNVVWGRLAGHNDGRMLALNPIQAPQGSHVIIGIEDGVIVRTTAWLYGLPLLGLLFGTAITESLWQHQGLVLLGALLGLSGGFLILKWCVNHAYISYKKAMVLRYTS